MRFSARSTAAGTNASTTRGARLVPLTVLKSGEQGVVQHRDIEPQDCEFLNALGLTHDCHLRVCRAGSQCIVQVAATRLGLSSAVAQRIMVAPQPVTE